MKISKTFNYKQTQIMKISETFNSKQTHFLKNNLNFANLLFLKIF